MDYTFDMDKIRVPYTTEPTRHAPRHHKTTDTVVMNQQSNLQYPLGRVPRDFIEDDVIQTSFSQKEKFVPDEKLEHGSTFPEKLIRPFILSTSKENDMILDPFIGSGTTAKVSLENGRKCIGYEISPVFVDTCYQRCGQVSERSIGIM